jgi:hypothetical protein
MNDYSQGCQSATLGWNWRTLSALGLRAKAKEQNMIRLLTFRRVVIAAFVFAGTILAAGNGMAQSQSARDVDERDIAQRSWNLRMLSIMAAQKRPRKFDPEVALSQVQEDFTRIQQINKPLGLMALRSSPLDLKFVVKSATEINKRAERLKENLALPDSADAAAAPKQYTANNATQLKAPIVSLARLILDFTGNPFFKDAGVVDSQAHLARRDLEDIIRISAEVRDLSRKLEQGGASGQTPNKP